MALMKTYIAGVGYHAGAYEALRKLWIADRLVLVREPDNPHDPRAVAVYTEEGLKLGYIPRADAGAVAKVMDLGLSYSCGFTGTPSGTSISVTWENGNVEY